MPRASWPFRLSWTPLKSWTISGTTTYTYDVANRTSAEGGLWADNNGTTVLNTPGLRTSLTLKQPTSTLTNLHQVTVNGVAITYDGNRNRTALSSGAYTYDGKNRLRKPANYTWSSPYGWSLTSETRYIYDGMLVVQERSSATHRSPAPAAPTSAAPSRARAASAASKAFHDWVKCAADNL